jgi:hypothetical protein
MESVEAKVIPLRPPTAAEGCWPHLLEMLQAMDAASEDESAAIWDDAEAWARQQGHVTPLEWMAEQDAADVDLEPLVRLAVATTGPAPRLRVVKDVDDEQDDEPAWPPAPIEGDRQPLPGFEDVPERPTERYPR